jgi:hypothetical protein
MQACSFVFSSALKVQVAAGIRKLWKQFFPEKLLRINNIEEKLTKQYEAESKLHELFLFFSGLTMFLSALGHFRAGSASGGTAGEGSRHPQGTGGVGSGYCGVNIKGFCQTGGYCHRRSLAAGVVCAAKVARKLPVPDDDPLVGVRGDWLCGTGGNHWHRELSGDPRRNGRPRPKSSQRIIDLGN